MADHPQAIAAATLALDLSNFFAQVEQASAVAIPDATVIASPDVPTLAFMLARIRKAVSELKDAERWVEDELVKVMPGKMVEVLNLGVIEMHTGASRKSWKKDELMDIEAHVCAAVVPADLFHSETGEPVNHIDLSRAILSRFLEAATPSWKVTGLRQHNIDPDEFCETTWGRKSIQTPALPTVTMINLAEQGE